MKTVTRSFFAVLILSAVALFSSCGSSGNTPSGVAITIQLAASAININAGQSTTITATVTGDTTNAGVGWSQSGPSGGSLTNASTFTVTYNAPKTLTGNSTASITATSVANSSVTASIQIFITGTPAAAVSVTANPTSIVVGQVSNLTATATGLSSTGIAFTPLPAVGTISSVTQTSTGATAVYTAPASITGNTQTVTITATSTANSSVQGTTTITICASAAACVGNTAQLIVDGGPLPSTEPYPNGVFATATICEPGTTTCTTIDHLLVDTGSFGVRILASELGNVALTPISSSGATLNNCIMFGDGSFLWGTVATADFTIAGEKASGIPIQVVADPAGGSGNIPSTCSGTDEDNVQGLLANGIIGVGLEPTDCVYDGANGCDDSTGSIVQGIYFWCTGAVNTADCPTGTIATPASQQVTNPIVAFTTDNNGSIITFPSEPSPAATSSGTITFGIGTESNNGIGTATVYVPTAQQTGWAFTTTYTNLNLTLPFSFIDSGSSALYIANPNNTAITVCSDNTGFFCPSSNLTGQSATNTGANGTSSVVPFTIDNADNLFTQFPTDYALSGLAGPFSTATDCTSGTTDSNCGFDWGFPFFYGRSVYTSIDETTVTGQPTSPWWAY
jgi:hypothetical protein